MSEVVRARLTPAQQAQFDQYRIANVYRAAGLTDQLPPLIAELASGSGHASVYRANQTEIWHELLASSSANRRSMMILDGTTGALKSFRYSDDLSGLVARRTEEQAIYEFLAEAPLLFGEYQPLDIGNRPEGPATWNFARVVDGWMIGRADGARIEAAQKGVVTQAFIATSPQLPSLAPAPVSELLTVRSTVREALLPFMIHEGWYRLYHRHFAVTSIEYNCGPYLPSWYGLVTKQDANQIIQHAEYVLVDPVTRQTRVNNGCPEVLGRLAPPQTREWGGAAWRFGRVSGRIEPTEEAPAGDTHLVPVWRDLEIVVGLYSPSNHVIESEGRRGKADETLASALTASLLGP